jgi:hypothetical protein
LTGQRREDQCKMHLPIGGRYLIAFTTPGQGCRPPPSPRSGLRSPPNQARGPQRVGKIVVVRRKGLDAAESPHLLRNGCARPWCVLTPLRRWGVTVRSKKREVLGWRELGHGPIHRGSEGRLAVESWSHTTGGSSVGPGALSPLVELRTLWPGVRRRGAVRSGLEHVPISSLSHTTPSWRAPGS